MDKAKVSNGAARGKAPKNQNSEVRKEQNRIASRAYREKRRQKLALLDQILKMENQESRSPSSELGDSPESLSVTYSRQASRSPAPAPAPQISAPAATTLWHSHDQTLDSVANFGGEAFDDAWLHGFDRSNDMYSSGQDFIASYHSNSVTDPSLETAHQFLPAIPSMAPCPPISLNHLASENHARSSYHDHSTHSTGTSGTSQTSSSSIYDESSFNTDQEPSVLAAFESFSKLNMVQQQQLLNVIYRRRSISPSLSTDRGWDMPITYQPSPPTGQFLGSDLRQRQSNKNSSRSPEPRHRH